MKKVLLSVDFDALLSPWLPREFITKVSLTQSVRSH
jgi:hypothetical protein